MPSDFLPYETMSPGERLRRVAYAATAVAGALLALVVAVRLGHPADQGLWLSTYGVWVTLAGLAGGFVGLRLTEHLFGHPGLWGAVKALLGILLICLVAPVVAGSLALPLYGTMFGPFMFGTTIVAVPLLGLLWAATLLAAHMCLAPWRRERESVFLTLQTDSRSQTKVTPRRGSYGSP